MQQVSSGHGLLLRDGDLAPRPQCLVCGSNARGYFGPVSYAGGRVTAHFRCKDCGLTYMDPVPTQAWYNRLYGEEFWEVKSGIDAATDVWSNERQWHKGLSRAEKYIEVLRRFAPGATIRSLLEVGASFGLIGATVADAFGAEAFGVEPNHAARDFASRASGMTMVGQTAADLDAWHAPAPLDLAIFSHVLENIIDPASALQAVHRKLKAGGLLLIEMSNSDTRPSTSLYHPCCYSVMALERLLHQCGFRVLGTVRSGRPTSAVVPLYLTVVAEANAAPAVPARARSLPSTSTVKLRHLLYRLYYKSPLGKLDLRVAKSRYLGTPFVKQGVVQLKERLGRLQAVRRSA